MASSKKRGYRITATLSLGGRAPGSLRSPQLAVSEPVHAAFANVKDRPEDFERFFKQWGLTSDVFAMTPKHHLRLNLRNILRAAWRGDEQALSKMRSESIPVMLFASKGGWEFEPDLWFQAMDLLFLCDYMAGKTAVCANQDCPNPYFIRKRKTQKYCEAGPCVAQAQREQKREWWNRNRGKGTK